MILLKEDRNIWRPDVLTKWFTYPGEWHIYIPGFSGICSRGMCQVIPVFSGTLDDPACNIDILQNYSADSVNRLDE